MKYFLFSAVHRCPPCRKLVGDLNREFPDWEKHIKYLDADNLSNEERELATKLGVMQLPTFTTKESILYRGYNSTIVKDIKELCLLIQE